MFHAMSMFQSASLTAVIYRRAISIGALIFARWNSKVLYIDRVEEKPIIIYEQYVIIENIRSFTCTGSNEKLFRLICNFATIKKL